ncbi:MAG: phage tail tape measure protein [Methanolobus sp.]|uniref:phage tail tape measure protein n=1 Tax=Methanolobus sp. TaxID=1874737 RepID=UPI002731C7FC|nr:phage tail tape measure protein [Methanolobus sp.]MDP2217406.1 phage tail tape measure protein [Methanolobus sp.]
MALAELVVSIIGDTAKLKQAFADVDKQIVSAGKSMQAVGQQMASAGKTMSLAVTAPLVGIAALSYKTAVDFDDSMRKVMAVSGATGEEFEQLRALARELGATTAFSASEAAEGMQYLAMAGFNVNEILAATDDMLALASAGAIDLGTAADIASNVLTGFGLNASEAGRVADVLAKAAASSNTDIQQLGEAMSYAAPLAAAMGMSMEEAAALIGKMSDAGIQGSRAGTALRGAMTRLASPTEGMSSVLKQYNLTLADVDPSTKSFTDILETLSKAGLSTADAMKLFGQEAGPGMLALMSTGTDAIREQTLALENAGGAAKEMADIMQGGPGGAARELKSAMEELMIVIGDIVMVAVLPLVKGLTRVAQTLSKVPTPVMRVIVMIAAVAAAIGPVLIIAGTLISSIGSILTLLGGAGLTATIGGLLTTIAPIVLVAASLAAVAYLIYRNWDVIGPKVADALDTIKAAIAPIVVIFRDFVKNELEKLKAWWDENGGTITEAVLRVASAVIWLVKHGIMYLGKVVESFLPPILALVEHIVGQILNVILFFSQVLIGDWEGAWGTLKTIVQTQMDFVMRIVTAILDPIADTFSSIGSKLYESGRALIQNFIDGIKSKADSLKSTVSDVLGGVGKYFPHSPAKEGPLKLLPNWDAYFIDPLQRSVGRMGSIVPDGLESVAGAVQNVANNSSTSSTTNNTYAGDEFVIQNVNLSADYPFERFVRDLEQYNRQKHVRRGY